MRKRILGVLLCLSIAVSMLAGCSSKEVDATNENVTAADNSPAKKNDDTEDVSKKLEKQYIERIEAYQKYFDEIRDKYSEYEFGATVTLDKEGLPLFWLCMGKSDSDYDADTTESDSWYYNWSTQLIGYKDKKATVLAERGEVIVPYRGRQLIMAADWRESVYLYDEEKMDFVKVVDELDELNGLYVHSNDYETIYSEKELNEKAERLSQMLECMNFFDTTIVARSDRTHQVAYLGRYNPDYYFLALHKLNAFIDVSSSNSGICIGLREEYAKYNTILNYFENLSDAKLDKDKKDAFFDRFNNNKQVLRIYDTIIKISPAVYDTYLLPDGTVYTDEKGKIYSDKLKAFDDGEDDDTDWEYEGGEVGEYFAEELDTERILRDLQRKPIFSQEELYTYLVSLCCDCEIIDVDLGDCILKEASNSFIGEVVRDYINGKESSFYTDEVIAAQSSLLETEPYKTINDQGVAESSFEDNVITLLCYDENEYQFQIEFNETGDKISKIEYIDPYANLPEWKKVYLDQLDMSQVWHPSLVDINGDGVPEIVACEESGGSSFGWHIYYIDKSNTIQQIDDVLMGCFDYGAGKVYSCGAHTGWSWDSIYSYNTSTGIYDLIFDGWGEDNFDEEGNYFIRYQIDEKNVSEKEYQQKVDDITADITNEYDGSENSSEDVNITDLIMNY